MKTGFVSHTWATDYCTNPSASLQNLTSDIQQNCLSSGQNMTPTEENTLYGCLSGPVTREINVACEVYERAFSPVQASMRALNSQCGAMGLPKSSTALCGSNMEKSRQRIICVVAKEGRKENWSINHWGTRRHVGILQGIVM